MAHVQQQPGTPGTAVTEGQSPHLPQQWIGEALNSLRKPRIKCDYDSVGWWSEGLKEKLQSVIRREGKLHTTCP